MNMKQEVLSSHLESQLQEYTKKYKEERGKADRRYNYLMTIAEKVCSNIYGDKQLGGKNKILSMSDMEIRDFIIKDHIKQRSRYIESIDQLQKMYIESQENVQSLSEKVLEQRKIIEEKENEILSLKAGGAIALDQVVEVETSYDPETGEIIETPVSQKESLEKEARSNKDIMLVKGEVVHLPDLQNSISEHEKVVMEAIGIKGLSETTEIIRYTNQSLKIKDTASRKIITSITEKGVIVGDLASTALNPRRKMYALTKVGKQVFQRMFDKVPVVCEKERLAQMHATLRHGICIKDTATILENLGYINVSFDEKANTFNVSGGQRYVPDVVAETEKGEKTFWEVELGHHHDNDFFDKMDKAARVAKEVYIISSTEPERVKLKKQVSAYMGKKMRKRGKKQEDGGSTKGGIQFTIYLGTMKQLMDRNIFTNQGCKFEIKS